MSNRFPGDADAAVPGTTRENHCAFFVSTELGVLELSFI